MGMRMSWPLFVAVRVHLLLSATAKPPKPVVLVDDTAQEGPTSSAQSASPQVPQPSMGSSVRHRCAWTVRAR